MRAGYGFASLRDFFQGYVMTKENTHLQVESSGWPEFETLFSTLSARFIGIAPSAVDAEIENAQRLVCEHFGLDACFLWQWDTDQPDILMMTHLYRPDGGPPVPERMAASEYFPWSLKKMIANEAIILSSLQDAPVEAARDVEICGQLGIKSTIAIPLATGEGPTFGAIGFNVMKKERPWVELIVQRLQLIAQVFAHALARKRSDELLYASGQVLRRQLDFEKLVSDLAVDVSTAELTAMDQIIDLTLDKVAKFFGADRVTLYRLNPVDKHLNLTNVYETVEAPQVLQVDPEVQFPWLWEKLHGGDAVTFSRLADLPEAAKKDRESFQHYGVKSHISVPVRDGETVKFVLAIGFLGEGVREFAVIHTRLKMLAHLLAGTIARKELEFVRDENIRFERMLSGVSAHLCDEAIDDIDQVINEVLQTVMEFFAFDMVGIHEFPSLSILYGVYARGVPEITHKRDRRDLYPWIYEKLSRGEMVVMNTAEIPAVAQKDREYFESVGFRSFAGLPLNDSAEVRYMLSCIDTHGDRQRWDKYAQRLRLLGSMLMNSLHRKRAWSELEKSERSLSRTQGISHVGSWDWDIGTNRLRCSIETCRILGMVSNHCEMTYDVYQERIHLEDREAVVESIRQAWETLVNRYDVQYRIVRPDGSERIIRHRADVIYGQQDEPMRMIGSIQDITEQSRIEAESSRLHLELAHLDRVVTASVMTGALAHEINQPLAAILSNAQAGLRLLDRGNVDLDDFRDLLRDIVQDDKRAGEVIRRLRTMLKKRMPQLEIFDLSTTVREMADFLHSESVMHKVDLDMDLAPQPLLISADSVQVQQVIVNLLMNGFQAVQNEPADRRKMILKTHANDTGQVLLIVSDSGPGIPPDRLANLFEPFHSTKSSGMGLGLAICQHIVRAYGGALTASNVSDGGAQFTLSLPAADS
jgi:PAS domain S-box-containing protein